MTSSISSSLPELNSLSLQIAELESESISSLISDDNDSAINFSISVCEAQTDLCTISTLAQSLSTAADTAESAGVSDEALENFKAFAAKLMEEDFDTDTILNYLDLAQTLVQSDPDQFEEVFSDSDSTETTIEALYTTDDSYEFVQD